MTKQNRNFPKPPSTGVYLSPTCVAQLIWLTNHFSENKSKTVTRLITERYKDELHKTDVREKMLGG